MEISKEEQEELLALARNTLIHSLGMSSEKIVPRFDSPIIHQPHGVFVTLHRHGQLRGCIGSIMPVESIVDGVRHNAINAAFHDSRFPRLTPEELADTEIEISILSNPHPLPFGSHEELLGLLKPDMGVILRQGAHQATFLPQVWQQLPDQQSFLEHLSLKAGLSKDGWQDPNIEISTYHVLSFHE